MAATLPWRTAARVAVRELRSSRGKFLFVVLSVAIGVAALTGVRGFAAAFRQTLLVRARAILAGDLGTRMFQQPSSQQLAALNNVRQSGVAVTQVTEMASMATAEHSFDPLLVALKAIDPSVYPFYGSVTLQPAVPLAAAVGGDNVAVGEDLLIRLRLKQGDRIQLGDGDFRIAAVVASEPDRLSGPFAAGPRILLSRQQLEQTHLLQPGSRASERFLFQLPSRDDGAVATLKKQVEAIFPEAQVTDYRETNPAITQALDRSTAILSLVSLVALVLGAVGVAMAMRTHLLERMDSIAIMKSLGAQSSHVLRIYLLQTVLLGLVGGVLGVLLGAAVQLALPLLLARLLGITPGLHVSPSAVAAGLLTGLIITVLFTLPPLLDIRKIRPILILRRNVDEAGTGEGVSAAARLLSAIRNSRAQLLATLLILAGLTLVAVTLTDSPRVGWSFTLALCAILLVLMATAFAMLAALRSFLRGTRLKLPPVLRHGLANLYRPGNPSAALLAALGMGVMQIATVLFISSAFLHQLQLSTLPNLPNVFLIDVATSELEPLRALLRSESEIQGTPEFLPIVSSRILSVDGVPAAQLKLHNFPERMLQSITLSWSEDLPAGTRVQQGHFWKPGETKPQVAIGQGHASRLHVKLGSHIVFASAGDPDHPVDAEVTSIIKSDGQHAYARAEFILPKAALQGMPEVWYGGVHTVPERVGELQRSLFARFPTVTVINVAQALETLRNVLLQVTVVVQFLAGFSVFAGLVILASAVAGTRYRRIREVVVLKTLGATRARIAAIFSVEFALLGLVAALVGLLFANVLSATLLHFVFDLQFRFPAPGNVLLLCSVVALTVATGWLASFRVLGQKPLEVLREE